MATLSNLHACILPVCSAFSPPLPVCPLLPGVIYKPYDVSCSCKISGGEGLQTDITFDAMSLLPSIRKMKQKEDGVLDCGLLCWNVCWTCVSLYNSIQDVYISN